MNISLPDFAIVLLIGPDGAGRQDFARRHFAEHEILALNQFKALLYGNAPGPNGDAFEALKFVLGKRLQHRQLTVIEAPLLSQKDRQDFRQLGRKYHVRVVALVFDFPAEEARQWVGNGVNPTVFQRQMNLLQTDCQQLESEKIRPAAHFKALPELEGLIFTRKPLRSNRRAATGPFDVVGDVHGCRSELDTLLERLGYHKRDGAWHHAQARCLVFVGDLVDRGPNSVGVLQLVMELVADGIALCVPGNHDDKLKRWLMGRNVKVKHGLETTVAELENATDDFRETVREFIAGLPAYLELDGGQLVVAHAGLKESMIGRFDGEIFSFCLYGETTGESDAFGLPIRHNWAGEYAGAATVVYGHTPIPEPLWQGNTLNIDTGCVFGGQLTAYRYPERELVSVAAEAVHAEPTRPLLHNIPDLAPAEDSDSLLDYARLSGRNLISTDLNYHITLKEEEAVATHEAMSTLGVHPRWMVYLPFDYSPPKLSSLPRYPEYPQQALDYYRKKGVEACMVHTAGRGKRVVVVLCRNRGIAREKFGMQQGQIGEIFTGKGQPALAEGSSELLQELRDGLEAQDWWAKENSDWVVLEGELTGSPESLWGGFAAEHAAISASAGRQLDAALAALQRAGGQGMAVESVTARLQRRRRQVMAYSTEVQRLAQPERLEVWHILAWEGQMGMQRPHTWHLAALTEMTQDLPRWGVPAHQLVHLDSDSEIRGVNGWFEEYTGSGGAGFVVKPGNFLMDGGTDIVQPGMKVRGPDALRLVYGPEYEDELALMRNRQLKDKRLRTIRQFALAHQGLKRFVAGEPLIQVYECIFTALSLEALDIDPRH